MAILLPGGAGFIGSHTAVELLQEKTLNFMKWTTWTKKNQKKYLKKTTQKQ